jgi:hypothetical protein
MVSFAGAMFVHNKALFEDALSSAGFDQFEKIWGDDYDNSIEFGEVDNDVRLTAAVQKVIFDAGFSRVFVNHKDGWETHYSWAHGESFEPHRGWRRRRTEKGFDISYWPEGWNTPGCADWLSSGYMTIVPDPLEPPDVAGG